MTTLPSPPIWFSYPGAPQRVLPTTSVRVIDFHLVNPTHRVEPIDVHLLDGHTGTFEGIYLWVFPPSRLPAAVHYYIGETSRLSVSRLHQYVEEVFALNQNRIGPKPYAKGRIPVVASGNGGGWGFRHINHELEHNLHSKPPGLHGIVLFVRAVTPGMTTVVDEMRTRSAGIAYGATIPHLFPTMQSELAATSARKRYLHSDWG